MKFLIGLLIFILIIFSVAAVFIFLNSSPDKLSDAEKEAAINEMLGRKANLNPDNKIGETSFNGKYISFEYPAKAEIYEYEDPQLKNNENLGEAFSFDIKNPRLVFNYTAKQSSNINDLDEVSAVIFRKNKVNGYEEADTKIDGVSGLIFTKQGSGEFPGEKSAFFLTGSALVSISVTGSSLKDIDKLFEEIINSAEFK